MICFWLMDCYFLVIVPSTTSALLPLASDFPKPNAIALPWLVKAPQAYNRKVIFRLTF